MPWKLKMPVIILKLLKLFLNYFNNFKFLIKIGFQYVYMMGEIWLAILRIRDRMEQYLSVRNFRSSNVMYMKN